MPKTPKNFHQKLGPLKVIFLHWIIYIRVVQNAHVQWYSLCNSGLFVAIQKELKSKKSDFYLENWQSASVFRKSKFLHCKTDQKSAKISTFS